SAAGLHQSGSARAGDRGPARACGNRARTGEPERLQEAHHGAEADGGRGDRRGGDQPRGWLSMGYQAGRSLSMADPFKFADRPSRRGALAEAAERFDRIVNIVKDQQLSHTQPGTAVRRPESEAYVLSPEEAWSRKYMIQCVGPVCTL